MCQGQPSSTHQTSESQPLPLPLQQTTDQGPKITVVDVKDPAPPANKEMPETELKSRSCETLTELHGDNSGEQQNLTQTTNASPLESTQLSEKQTSRKNIKEELTQNLAGMILKGDSLQLENLVSSAELNDQELKQAITDACSPDEKINANGRAAEMAKKLPWLQSMVIQIIDQLLDENDKMKTLLNVGKIERLLAINDAINDLKSELGLQETSQLQSLQQTVKEFHGTLQEIQQGIGLPQADKGVTTALLISLKTRVEQALGEAPQDDTSSTAQLMEIGDKIGGLEKMMGIGENAGTAGSKTENSGQKSHRDMENALQAELIVDYLKSTGLDLTKLTPEEIRNLPFPQLPFASQDPVVNGKTIEEIQNKNPETLDYLKNFLTQTGVSPMCYNRVVVNMSGEENLCGYRAILSQIDKDSAGTALAHSFQGGTIAMSTKTVRKANMLRLAIAVGRAKDHPEDVQKAGGLQKYLEIQMEILRGEINEVNRDTVGGMLGAEDAKYLAIALKRPIIIVESNENNLNRMTGNLKAVENELAKARNQNDDARIASLEEQLQALRRSIDAISGGGGSVRIFDTKGDVTTYNTICADDDNTDAVPSGMLTASQKQKFLRDALNNPNAIALFNVHGNHYMALQRTTS